MKQRTDISVVIVSYNTRQLLAECLSAVMASDTGSYRMQVIVVDNASDDGSAAMVSKEYPSVRLIVRKRNTGFSAGNNTGIKQAVGKYILLLNSDTEVGRTSIRDMVSFMDRTDAGAATCKLLLPDGSMDPACHRGIPTPWAAFTYYLGLERIFPKNRLFARYHQGYADMTSVHQVDCISGAFFLVRKSVIEKVGMLDEAYFMYAEDIDWAYRICRHGYRILFNPAVTALHKKKQSGRAHRDRKRRLETEILFHRSNLLFYEKHLRMQYHPLVTMLIRFVYGIRIASLKLFA